MPGDVVSCGGLRGFVVENGGAGLRVAWPDGSSNRLDMMIGRIAPLAAIDPEEVEEVERLARESKLAYWKNPESAASTSDIDAMRAALREFADPTPQIEEPLGLGAVIFATCNCEPERKRFVRDHTGSEFPDDPWKAECGHHKWSDLSVRDADDVLSEGVATDA